MNQKLFVICFFAGVAASLNACDEGAYNDLKCDDAYQTECLSAEKYMVCEGGMLTVKDCAANTYCHVNDSGVGECVPLGEPLPVTECTDGAEKCENGSAYVCSNGKWDAGTSCANGCDADAKKCAAEASSCTAGDKRCEDNKAYVCGDAGWDAGTECSNGCDADNKECAASVQKKEIGEECTSDDECESGSCYDICIPAEPYDCTGFVPSCEHKDNKVIAYKSCSEEGIVSEECSYDCLNGACITDPGERECLVDDDCLAKYTDGSKTKCNSSYMCDNGESETDLCNGECSEEEVCSYGDCVPKSLEVKDAECDSYGDNAFFCDGDVLWFCDEGVRGSMNCADPDYNLGTCSVYKDAYGKMAGCTGTKKMIDRCDNGTAKLCLDDAIAEYDCVTDVVGNTMIVPTDDYTECVCEYDASDAPVCKAPEEGTEGGACREIAEGSDGLPCDNDLVCNANNICQLSLDALITKYCEIGASAFSSMGDLQECKDDMTKMVPACGGEENGYALLACGVSVMEDSDCTEEVCYQAEIAVSCKAEYKACGAPVAEVGDDCEDNGDCASILEENMVCDDNKKCALGASAGCTPDETKCVDNIEYTCQSNGSWDSGIGCDVNEACDITGKVCAEIQDS